jgi:NAD(P)-dependent dehydrogenase (short-subunit alcohol dehydrogenase family)
LADEKITVNAVCPGILRTGIAIGANDWYGEAEKLNLIVKMESLLNAFSYLLGDNPTSGECFEIPPGKIDNPEGWVIKEQTPFTTPESEVHAAYSNKQFSHLHAPIAE